MRAHDAQKIWYAKRCEARQHFTSCLRMRARVVRISAERFSTVMSDAESVCRRQEHMLLISYFSLCYFVLTL